MRFRVKRELLAEAVAWGTRNVPSRPAIPVLAGALLRVEEGVLSIASYDHEASARINVEVDAQADGAALVSGRLLAEISRALPDQTIDITATESGVELRCGNGRFKLPTMPVEDYPRLPELPALAGRVDASAFAAAVAQVATAVSREESLPILTGVRVAVDGERMTLLSSDRYRAARRELRWQPVAPKIDAEFLVPGRALAEAAKAFAGRTGELELALDQDVLSGGTLGFRAAGRQLTSRLLDGTYPPIGRLFEVEHPDKVTVAVAALTEVVKRVALFSERTTPILIQLDSAGLTVEAHGSQDAEASERIDAAYTGTPTTLAFNEGYLLDGLSALEGPELTLSFVAPLKPVALRPTGNDFAYMIQPVRVNS